MSDYLRLVAGDLVRARAIAASAGAGDASKLVATNGSGVLDASLVSGLIPARGALDLFTLATMPSPAANTGRLIYVSDAPSNPSVCFSDGTLWRKVSDRSAVYRPGTGPQSMFATLAPPANWPSGWDGPTFQVGVRFAVTTPGLITALRYYRIATPTWDVPCRLIRQDNTVLASGVFPIMSGSGWQSYILPTPLEILPGTDYYVVASYATRFGTVDNNLLTDRTIGAFIARNTVSYPLVTNMNTVSWVGSQNGANPLRDVVFEPYGT